MSLRTGALILVAMVGLARDPEPPGAELVEARAQALDLEPMQAGGRGELSVVLLEAPERDLPLVLRFDDGPVTFDDNRLDWGAVADPLALQPRLRAAFTAPTEPGSYAIEGSVTYWVCTPRWCRRKRGTLRWALDVTGDPKGRNA